MKKKILIGLQFALAIGLIGFFVFQMDKKGQIATFADTLKTAAGNWPWLGLGVSCFLGCLLLCNWRWKILLETQGINISFPRTMMLYLVGQFFSSFMPGATSGDLFKMIYISRECPTKKTEAVSTVFMDRITGLIALILLTSMVTLTRLDFFLSNSKTKLVMLFNIIILLGMVAGLTLVFAQNIFEKIPLFKKLEEKTSLGKIISKLYNAFRICIKNPSVLIKTITLSLVNHILFIFLGICVAKSIGVSMPLTDYFTVFPIIAFIGAIPLTPGGLGTRDAAAVFMLGLLGIAEPAALSISILIYLGTLFWSAVGGIVYLFYIITQGKPDLTNTNEPQSALS